MNFLHKTLLRTPKSTNFAPSNPIIRLYSSNNDNPKHQINKKLGRPSEIPFQPKVVNWVNLVGTVSTPINFCTSDDGKFWAATLLSHHLNPLSPRPSTWIPIIFKGDLAVTAASHLKENDNVHIAGHLSVERVPINLIKEQSKIRVMVHDLHLVRLYPGVMTHLFSSLHRMKNDR